MTPKSAYQIDNIKAPQVDIWTTSACTLEAHCFWGVTQGAAQCNGRCNGRRILINIVAGYALAFEMMTDAERAQRKWT